MKKINPIFIIVGIPIVIITIIFALIKIVPSDSGLGFVALILFLLAVMGVIAIDANIKLFISRRIRDLPTSKIHAASQGYVELKGKCINAENKQLISPLNKIPCVWFSCRVTKRVENQNGRNETWPVEECNSDDFLLLTDGTDVCLVAIDTNIDPSNFTTLHDDGWFQSSYVPINSFNGSENASKRNKVDDSYKYSESCICADDEMYVMGEFKTLHKASDVDTIKVLTFEHFKEVKEHAKKMQEMGWKGWEEWYKKSIGGLFGRTYANFEAVMEKYDHNKDGTIDMSDWYHSRLSALEKVKSNFPELIRNNLKFNVIFNTNKIYLPLIISTKQERKLATKYRRESRYEFLAAFLISLLIALFFAA